MNAPVTNVAVGEPVIVVKVWLVPLTVVAATEPSEALPDPTNVSESEPLLQAAGMDESTTVVTTFAVDVHEMPIPLDEPHELAEAVFAAMFLGFGVTWAARAASACATARAVKPTTAT